MKKILVFIFAFIFIIVFCGCGTIEDSGSNGTTVYMYDSNGDVIQQWTNILGAYERNCGVELFFENGDSIEIYNAPVMIVR